ncbi:T9SS type A sorting domain-containing protein [Belliella marina]|uniref:T9SS type A sorting domain-containing protein n=1 Tax=Belliella marina TaxID=1644146 RepID=A0ABW4VMF1_9BACT
MKALVFTFSCFFCNRHVRLLGSTLFLITLMGTNLSDIKAEGSGDWGTATNRQSMLWVPASGTGVSSYRVRGCMFTPSTATAYNTGHRLYVYVKSGETVFYGFHRTTSTTETTNVSWFYDPSDTGFFPTGTGSNRLSINSENYNLSGNEALGRPASANSANLGPKQITNTGYDAYSFVNNTGSDRAFWVELSTYGFNIDFWDITVASGSSPNYIEHKGRVYSRFWSIANSRSSATSTALTILNKGQADAYSFHEDFGFYVPIDNTYTADVDDYFVKRIKFPGSSGGWTNFFANQDGPRNNLSYEENRKSITTTSSNNFQYPLFINDPDPTIWKTTTPPSATLEINYREKNPPATGGEANVNISITLPAIVDILIDINGNGEFDSNEDVILSEIYEEPGEYTIYWNGEDANGIELPSGGEVNFIASVAFFPVHFPIYDLEQCLGIHVSNIRPGIPNEIDFIFWDDSLIPRTGLTPSDSPQSIEVNVTGVESPEHIWWATGDNGFSNNITINTWTASFYRVVQRTSGFTFLSISGNVFEDLNALEDDTVNGEGIDIPDFYAVLIDDQNNVVSFATIQSDGTYTINDVPNGIFSIFITTEMPTLGGIAPNLTLPEYYENTGEFLGTGEGSDGTVDGILNNIEIQNASIGNANFGIRPIEYDLIAMKTVNALKPNIGDEIIFTISVENAGYSNATQVFLDEFMPDGYEYVDHYTLKGTFDHYSSPAIWEIGDLASWESATLEITVKVLDSEDYRNTVEVYSESGVPETNFENNFADADTEPFRELPVDWLSFDGKLTDSNQALLKWSTAKERDSKHFIVQRSRDIKQWASIGQTAAQGNTDEVSQYQFTDPSPMPGSNYYRLEQVDFDGKTNLSKVILVDFKPNWSVKVYPNPFADEIFIQTKNLGEIHVTMMDNYGRTIFSNSSNVEDYSFHFDTKDLQNGLYYLKIHRGPESYIYKLKK